jgi:hypothetical protein
MDGSELCATCVVKKKIFCVLLCIDGGRPQKHPLLAHQTAALMGIATPLQESAPVELAGVRDL